LCIPASPRRTVIDAAVERGINAQITTQLDAGVGTRNIEETSTIQGGDPHVLDRFGLDGKITPLMARRPAAEPRIPAEARYSEKAYARDKVEGRII
jgi:hypothetical protein